MPVTFAATGVRALPAAPPSNWITGYWASWQASIYPVNRIDFSALTHIVAAHWLTNADGTISANGTVETLLPSLVTAAHAAGVKVIMMLGGSDDVNYPTATNGTNLATLISSIASKISTFNLDGVDFDWENSIIDAQFVNLVTGMRSAHPNFILTAPLTEYGSATSLAVSLAPYLDQVNLQMYGFQALSAGWVSWYFSALKGDRTPDHNNSDNLFIQQWLAAGVPAAKIGFGIGFYGVGWSSPVTDALQTISTSTSVFGELPYGYDTGPSILNYFYNQAGTTYLWSGVSTGDKQLAQSTSLSIPGGITPGGSGYAHPVTWVTYEDEASIAAKTAYIKSLGLGGMIIWTINEGTTNSAIGRNPQLDQVKLGLKQQGPTPITLVGSSGATSVAGATSVTITGLPSDMGKVVVKFWNGTTTSFDINVGSYGDYGRPSEYYIEASVNGSSWISLTHVTGNQYNGRQFFYDFTSTGYTQVRLRVVSIVGANAGTDLLTVHRADGAVADTFLLLGDSITSNCWEAGSNTGGYTNGYPNENFGLRTHNAHSNRYPVMTEGGIPGLTSSSILDTVAYGIPVIRQWMNDFPSVKFVGLSYGTNDANGGVSATTYYNNMLAIVQEVIAAGKTPIIPTIVSSPATNVQANAPAMNTKIATLIANYPAIITGPDLWALFTGHSVGDGWFFDTLHPSLDVGTNALEQAWVNTMGSYLHY